MLESSPCGDSESYKIIVVREALPEALLAPTPAGFVLPQVRIPRGHRVVENINAAMRSDWGEEIVCLFAPDVAPSGDSEPSRYQVAAHRRPLGQSKQRREWVRISALSALSFSDPAEHRALAMAVAQQDGYAQGVIAGSFGSRGWFRQLLEWAEEAIAPTGLRLSGNIRQLNACPSFSLIRLETTGAALWFKAVGEPNLQEFPITLALASNFPRSVPTVLATRADWNGWLSWEVAGVSLDETRDPESWIAAAAEMAGLQIDSIGNSRELSAAGARDLRANTLLEQVHPLLEVMGDLMEQQTQVRPSAVSREELARLEVSIKEAFAQIRHSPIPDTLGHLDLNPGNIFVSGNRCVFLDWAEAYVGHPFFCLEYLKAHLRQAIGHNPALEQRLTDAYVARWYGLVAPSAVAEAVSVCALLAAFAYATAGGVWRDARRLQDANTCAYLRSLTRRMNQEAKRLRDRRSACHA